MRTASPLVTCSRTHDCGPSATAGSISSPRIIGPGCKHERLRLRQPQALRRELVLQNIFFGGNRRFVDTLRLHAQHDDHIRAVQRFFDSQYAAHVRRQALEFARHPHGRPAQRDPRAELRQQVNIRPRHAAVQDVADNGDVPAFEFSRSCRES